MATACSCPGPGQHNCPLSALDSDSSVVPCTGKAQGLPGIHLSALCPRDPFLVHPACDSSSAVPCVFVSCPPQRRGNFYSLLSHAGRNCVGLCRLRAWRGGGLPHPPRAGGLGGLCGLYPGLFRLKVSLQLDFLSLKATEPVNSSPMSPGWTTLLTLPHLGQER